MSSSQKPKQSGRQHMGKGNDERANDGMASTMMLLVEQVKHLTDAFTKRKEHSEEPMKKHYSKLEKVSPQKGHDESMATKKSRIITRHANKQVVSLNSSDEEQDRADTTAMKKEPTTIETRNTQTGSKASGSCKEE